MLYDVTISIWVCKQRTRGGDLEEMSAVSSLSFTADKNGVNLYKLRRTLTAKFDKL